MFHRASRFSMGAKSPNRQRHHGRHWQHSHAYPSGQREPAQDRLFCTSQVRILSHALRPGEARSRKCVTGFAERAAQGIAARRRRVGSNPVACIQTGRSPGSQVRDRICRARSARDARAPKARGSESRRMHSDPESQLRDRICRARSARNSRAPKARRSESCRMH